MSPFKKKQQRTLTLGMYLGDPGSLYHHDALCILSLCTKERERRERRERGERGDSVKRERGERRRERREGERGERRRERREGDSVKRERRRERREKGQIRSGPAIFTPKETRR